MKLTNKEKDILNLALTKLEEYYDEREKICREFKWICHAHLPQSGEDYVANKNVFDIQDKTIEDIKISKLEARKTIMRLINEQPNTSCIKHSHTDVKKHCSENGYYIGEYWFPNR